ARPALSREPRAIFAGLVDGHAGAVLAVHVRAGVCGGQSQDDEAGGVIVPEVATASCRQPRVRPALAGGRDARQTAAEDGGATRLRGFRSSLPSTQDPL